MRAGFHTIKVGVLVTTPFGSQSLVNEGRFPPKKNTVIYTRVSTSQSLVNEGRFPLKTCMDRWGYFYEGRNPSLMRAGFH